MDEEQFLDQLDIFLMTNPEVKEEFEKQANSWFVDEWHTVENWDINLFNSRIHGEPLPVQMVSIYDYNEGSLGNNQLSMEYKEALAKIKERNSYAN